LSERVQTQMLRYFLVSQALMPPCAFNLTGLPRSENSVLVVLVKVMPVVALPAGSLVARANSIWASATRPLKTPGVLLLSGFLARKSRLRTAIWLFTCATEIFSAGEAGLCTT